MKFMHRAIILLCSLLSLQGCFFAAGAAAGAAAIAIVYDHRSLQNRFSDTNLATRVYNRLALIPEFKSNSHIEVTAFHGIILLTGQTPKLEWREEAEEIAKKTPGVVKVYNQVTIQGPTSTLTRTSDSWITTKIKTLMLANENLRSSSIKVVTENGVVYLMGVVDKHQAQIASDIARQVSGVQKVIRMFIYTE
jgi:osmotically-inducible protein OsmY